MSLPALGAIASLAGTAMNTFSSVASPVIGGLFGLKQVDMANQANKDIAKQNLGFQRENLDYQKALQQHIFDREDTAYQRTVSDMRNAGISPLAMQGTNGAGEAISTTPMNNGYQAQASNFDMGSAIQNGINGLSGSILGSAQTVAQLAQAREAVRGQKLDNDLKALTLHDNAVKSGIDLNRLVVELSRSRSAHQYEKTFGFNQAMNPLERMINGIFSIVGDGLHSVNGSGDNAYNSYRKPGIQDFSPFSDKAREALNVFSVDNAIDNASNVVGAIQDKALDKIDKQLGIEHKPDENGKKKLWNWDLTPETREKLRKKMTESWFNKIFHWW